MSTGEIAIFVVGDVSFAKNLDIVLSGGDSSDVFLETHGNFFLAKNSDWFGTVFAPTGNINFDKDAVLIGAAYSGQQVNIGKNASLALVAADRLLGQVDTDPPVITAGLVNDTGTNNTDGITSDPAVSGTVTDANTITQLLLTVTPIAGGASGGPFDVTADINPIDGSFVFDRSSLEALLGQPLVDDQYTISLRAQDEFGNASSLGVSFTLDTGASSTISLTSPSEGLITNTNLTVTGQVTDPSSVFLLEAQIDTGQFFGVILDAVTGAFSFDTTFALDATDDGTHTITVRATDLAGNTSGLAQVSVTLDTVTAAPVITGYDQDTGISNSDNLTSDTRLTFTGTAEANSQITVIEAGLGVIGTATANAAGNWTVDGTNTILSPDGVFTFTATSQDLAGNVSGASGSLDVTVDTTDSMVVVNSPAPGLVTNDNVIVSGQVTDLNGVSDLQAQIDSGLFFNVTFDAAGNFSFSTTLLLDGSDDGIHTVGIVATDTAGNEIQVPVETSFTLDTTSPLILSAPFGTFNNTFDSFTVDFTEDMAANAFNPAGYALVVSGGVNDGQVIAIDSVEVVSGNTSRIHLAQVLPDQNYILTASSLLTDLAQNSVAGNTEFAFAIQDTTAPTITEAPEGSFSQTFSTFTVAFSEAMGTASLDVASYSLIVAGGVNDGQNITIASVDSVDSTSVQITLVTALPSNQGYQLTVASVLTDVADNALTGSTVFDFTVDTTAPTIIDAPQGVLNDAVQSVDIVFSESMSDTASGASVYNLVVNGGANDGQVIVVELASLLDDTVRIYFDQVLPDQSYTLTVDPSVSDLAGNTLSGATSFDFTVADTTAPEVVLAPEGTRNQTFASFIVNFSEPMASDTFEPDRFTLSVDGGVNNGQIIPIESVDAISGAIAVVNLFEVLPDQSYTLAVDPTSTDLAGNAVTGTTVFSFTVSDPTGISEFAPFDGEERVSVTREIVVRLDEPVDPATVTSSSFIVIGNGQPLAGTLRVGNDEKSITFFHTDPFPASTVVRVMVDGDQITGRDGFLLDADGDNIAGGQAVVDFETISLTQIEGTDVFGYVYDSNRTNPDGSNIPIVGATIQVEGLPGVSAVTDATGYFLLEDVPAPEFFVKIDATTAPVPAGFTYPSIRKPFHSVAGHAVQLEMDGQPFDVFLPLIADSDLIPVVIGQETVATFGPQALVDLSVMFPSISQDAWERLAVTINPDSVFFDDGTLASQMTVLALAPDRIPAPLPAGQNPLIVFSVDAGGAQNVDGFAQLTYPNLDGLDPGEKRFIWAFDHDAGEWVVTGTVTVSDDGLTLNSDPESGIRTLGWRFVANAPGTTSQFVGATTAAPDEKVPDEEPEEEEENQTDSFVVVDKNAPTLTANNGITQIPPAGQRPGDLKSQKTNDALDLDATTYFDGVLNKTQTVREQLDRIFGNQWPTRSDAANILALALTMEARARGIGGLIADPNILQNQDPLVISTIIKFLRGNGATVQHKPTDRLAIEAKNTNAFKTMIADFESKLQQEIQKQANNGFVDLDGIGITPIIPSFTNDNSNILKAIIGGTQGVEITYESSAKIDPANINIDPENGGGQGTYQIKVRVRLFDPFGVDETDLRKRKFPENVGEKGLGAQFLLQHVSTTSGAQPFLNEIIIDDVKINGTFTIPADYIEKAPGSNRPTNGPPNSPSSQLAVADSETSTDLGDDPQVFYRFTFDNGFELAGTFEPDNVSADLVLPTDQTFIATLYQPSTNSSLQVATASGPNAQPTILEDVPLGVISAGSLITLDRVGGIDTDGDGIPDVGEIAIGSDPNVADTDGDGIVDSAEIAQGLNPLDGRAFPTGIVASLPLLGDAIDVDVQGSTLDSGQLTAYVATGTYGLAIVDVSQFDNPIVLTQIDLPGTATSVAVDPRLNIVAVASNTDGLHLVDISDPVLPALIQTIAIDASVIEVVDGQVFVAVAQDLHRYDLLTGDFLEELSLGGGVINGLAREGSMLYAVTSTDRLQVVDISGVSGMVLRGSVILQARAQDIFVGNGIAYVANGIENTTIEIPDPSLRGGYTTIDVSDADVPVVISGIDTPEVQAGNLKTVTNGSGLALVAAGFRGLEVHDASNPGATYNFLTQITTTGQAQSVAIAEGIAYVADGTGGLQVINFRSFDNFGQAPTVVIDSSVIDVDPATPGTQVTEGTSVPIVAQISDDVQVRNAELLINGVVVGNDVSFPFDFSAVVPSLSGGLTSVSIQVRATDTGGNVALSAPLIFDIVADTVAPSINLISPFDGAASGIGPRTVRIGFSESMDRSTLTAQNIRLLGDSDPVNPITPIDVLVRADNQFVQITYASLPADGYQIVIDGTTITDRAGNALGTGDVTSSFSIVDATAFWINPTGGFWDDPNNWESGVVPGSSDNVFISVPGDVTITHQTGTTIVNSIVSMDRLELTGGRLEVTDFVQVNNDFIIQGGTLANATVLPGSEGQGVTVIGNTNSTLDGVTLNADLDMSSSVNYTTLHIANGLTLNGTITVNSNIGEIFFDANTSGQQVLDGIGEIVYTVIGFGTKTFTVTVDTLTIETGVTVRGPKITFSRAFGSSGPRSTLINRGTIISEFGTPFDHINIFGRLDLDNQGVIAATDNGNIDINENWVNNGTISASSGGDIDLKGTFTLGPASALIQNGGTIDIEGVLNNTGQTFTLNASTGSIRLDDGTILGGTIETLNDTKLIVRNTNPNNASTWATLDGVVLNGDVDLGSGDVNARLDIQNGITLNGNITVSGDQSFIIFKGVSQTIDGQGELVFVNGTTGVHTVNVNIDTLTVESGVTIRGGGVLLQRVGAGLTSLINRGTIIADDPTSSLLFTSTFSTATSPIALINEGVLQVATNSTLEIQNLTGNTGQVILEDQSLLIVTGDYTQSSGVTDLAGGTLQATGLVNLLGGVLSGRGTVIADVTNAGQIDIGGSNAAGLLEIQGNYTQQSTGILNMELGGLMAGSEFDQLSVTGSVTLAGTLNMGLIGGFMPSIGDVFEILIFGSRVGDFDTKNGLDLGSVVLGPVFDLDSLDLVGT